MIHELFPHPSRSRLDEGFRRQKRRCVEEADLVICISETTRSDLLAVYGIPEMRTRVIPLGCNERFEVLQDATVSDERPTDGPYLLYVGERYHYKGFETLMRAYAVWDRHHEAGLVVVGPTWSRQESEELKRLKIGERVVHMGYVDDRTLCVLYNRALALVYPSLYEGFGLPLLEAMACGCPIVASRIPSTIEVAGDYPSYFEPGDEESLLAALDKSLIEGRPSPRLTEGVARAKRFSWNDTATQTLTVYRALI